MRMKAPPPIPELAGLTTPKHRAEAMAASAAFPPLFKMSTPTWEHTGWSVATAPFRMLSTHDEVLSAIRLDDAEEYED